MRLASRPIAAIAIVLTIALGLPLATEAPAAAATTISFTPAQPMAREYTWVRGKLPTRVVRPVYLQYYKPGSGWTMYPLRYQGDGARARTFSGGYFRFRPRAIAPYRAWRVVAPRRTINGTTYRAIVSNARRMYTVNQTALLRLVPAPIGQLANTTTSDATPVNLAFRPIRPGRAAHLQRYISGGWRKVASGVQDSRGYATFNIRTDLARNYNHRAVAGTYNGATYALSKPAKAEKKPMRFGDNFASSSLNLNKWSHRGGVRNSTGLRNCSEGSPSAVRIARNGAGKYDYLQLQVKEIREGSADYDHVKAALSYEDGGCPDGQYYNGHIGTHDGKFNTTNGILAARMRLAPGFGKHSAFWARPTGGTGSVHEIDIMEYFGNKSNIQNKVYYSGGSDGRVFDLSRFLGTGKTYTNSFHIFSVEWTPSVYIFRVDGYETFRTPRGLSSDPHFMILSLLSSDYELPKLNQSTLPHSTFVDWVRVWR